MLGWDRETRAFSAYLYVLFPPRLQFFDQVHSGKETVVAHEQLPKRRKRYLLGWTGAWRS